MYSYSTGSLVSIARRYLHGGEFRLLGGQDLFQRPADHEVAGPAGMALPGGIGILADDTAIRLDGLDDEIDRRVLEDGAVARARPAQLVDHLVQGPGALGNLALQLPGE